MLNLKQHCSNAFNLCDLSHLSTWHLSLLLEQYVDHILHAELGNLVVKPRAALHPETLNWSIWVRLQYQTFSCEIDKDLQDWFPLESMIAEIKLCV